MEYPTLGQLADSVEALNRLSVTKLPIKMAFEVSRILKRVTPEVQTFHEVREAKFKEWSRPTVKTDPEYDENVKDQLVIKEEFREQFRDEMKELTATEVKFHFKPISITELEKLNISIEPGVLYALEWLFKDEPDEFELE